MYVSANVQYVTLVDLDMGSGRLLEECIKVVRITVLQYILGSGIASVILLLSNCKVFVTHLKILQYFSHYHGPP